MELSELGPFRHAKIHFEFSEHEKGPGRLSSGQWAFAEAWGVVMGRGQRLRPLGEKEERAQEGVIGLNARGWGQD